MKSVFELKYINVKHEIAFALLAQIKALNNKHAFSYVCVCVSFGFVKNGHQQKYYNKMLLE